MWKRTIAVEYWNDSLLALAIKHSTPLKFRLILLKLGEYFFTLIEKAYSFSKIQIKIANNCKNKQILGSRCCRGCLNNMIITIGSSRLQMFFKMGILKNFEHFTGKHLCRSLCWTWRPATLLKRQPNTGVFLWNLRNF